MCFVFYSDGKIRLFLLNVPGTFYNSTMAYYGIYDGIDRVYNATGGKAAADSAFKIGTKLYLIKLSQQDPTDGHALLLNRKATSIRQLSEWGMRTIQGTALYHKDPLQFDELGERNVILCLMVHLYNFHTAIIGINQIMNLFTKTNTYLAIGILNRLPT